MINDILLYKDYITSVKYSSVDNVLYGRIEGIKDLVIFECETVNEVEKEFHAAVDDYLTFCAEVGKEPDKVFKGTFNVRIDPELHRSISMLAFKNSQSLNQTVEKAIKEYVKEEKEKIVDRESSTNIQRKILGLWQSSNNYKQCRV